MGQLLKIDDEIITEEDFIKNLKLTNQFSHLLEDLCRNKVTVHAAKKRAIELSTEEIQNAANTFRLSLGLHRSKDTHDWMQRMNISLDDFENFISEQLYKNKIIEMITSDEEIETYFELNSPKFDTIDINYLSTDSEDKAKEIVALLNEDPDSFDELAEEFMTSGSEFEKTQKINGIKRGSLSDDISAKLFNAQIGDVIGPFHMREKDNYEVLMLTGIHPAELNNEVKEQISELLYDNWLQSRLQEHRIT